MTPTEEISREPQLKYMGISEHVPRTVFSRLIGVPGPEHRLKLSRSVFQEQNIGLFGGSLLDRQQGEIDRHFNLDC